jgi:hypothetical protein
MRFAISVAFICVGARIAAMKAASAGDSCRLPE